MQLPLLWLRLQLGPCLRTLPRQCGWKGRSIDYKSTTAQKNRW